MCVSETVRSFFSGINNGWPWQNHNPLTQLSAAFFEHTARLAATWRPGAILLCHLPVRWRTNCSEEIQNIGSFYSDFVAVNQRIDEFKPQLTPIEYRSSFQPERFAYTPRDLSLQWCNHSAARHIFVAEYRFSGQVLVRCDGDRACQSGHTRAGLRFHQSDSRRKCLSLFHFKFHFVNRLCFWYVDSLWAACGRVIVDEIVAWRRCIIVEPNTSP